MQVSTLSSTGPQITQQQGSHKSPREINVNANPNPKKTRKSNLNNPLSSDHLDDFFAQYPAFRYRKNSSSAQEFYRMCDFFDWDRNDPERKDAHDAFKTALVHQFNSLYGTEVDSIESWRGLSSALDILPLPDNVGQAKKMFRGMFINLVDLVDTAKTGQHVRRFRNLEELREYTIESGKFFPKKSAYAGGMLKLLLREILNKHHGRKRR